jgi:CubicO group peptidase (beta-lactamase class C family)
MTWTDRRDAALATRTEMALEAAIREKRIVGAVLRVARDGALVAHHAVGWADRESRRPMTEDTPFRLASITKPIVTATALDLIGRGILSLDDAVTKWLPDFTPTFEGRPATITIRHLLTHTSGLAYGFLEQPDGPYHRAKVSDALDAPGLSLEENLRRLATVPLAFRPGSAFLYSLSLDVLGAIIERATNTSLPEAVARVVTKPLAMNATGFRPQDPEELATPYADGTPEPVPMVDGIYVPYAGAGATFAPSRALDPRSYPSGGAGMIGTAKDIHTFLEALRVRDRFAPQALVDEMFRDQITPIVSPILRDGWGFGYGAAVLRDPKSAGVPMNAGTIRWGGAFGHYWWIDPSARLSVVLLTNTAFEGMAGKTTMDVVNAVYGTDTLATATEP